MNRNENSTKVGWKVQATDGALVVVVVVVVFVEFVIDTSVGVGVTTSHKQATSTEQHLLQHTNPA